MKGLLTVATTFLSITFIIALLVSLSMGSGGASEGSGLVSLAFVFTLITGLLTAICWYQLRNMNNEE